MKSLKRKRHKWPSYEEAKEIINPYYIPGHPLYSYKGKGWVDWYDWLGTTRQ